MSDRIIMLNRALLRIGAEPLVTEADPGAPVHLAVYDSVLEHFSAAPFSFLKSTRKLARKTVAPISQWQYAFLLPSDRMGPPRAVYASADTSRRPLTTYDIQGDALLSDEPELWATVLSKTGWEKWPGDFREAFITALMAELALSIREDRVLHRELYAKAYGSPAQGGVGGLFGLALDRDSQGIPATVVGGGYNPLVDVRF